MDLVVKKSIVSFHSAPSLQSEQISQTIYGSFLKMLEKEGKWLKVLGDDGYEGWIEACSVSAFQEEAGKKKLFVRAFWTPLFEMADTQNALPKLCIPYGGSVLVEDFCVEDPRWFLVKTVEKEVLFAQKEDFSQSPLPPLAKTLIKEAKRFLGVPYLWGGVTPQGFDCSGFTQTIYRQIGIVLPRDASLQISCGKKVEEEAFLGDLLFFSSPKNRLLVTHVALSLGKNRFIHSSTTHLKGTRGVRIDSLEDPYWQVRFLEKRRIL